MAGYQEVSTRPLETNFGNKPQESSPLLGDRCLAPKEDPGFGKFGESFGKKNSSKYIFSLKRVITKIESRMKGRRRNEDMQRKTTSALISVSWKRNVVAQMVLFCFTRRNDKM